MTLSHSGKLHFADGFEIDGKWVVMSGSYAKHFADGPFDDARQLREELIGKGLLYQDVSGLYRFSQDVTFSNANAAAGIINGKMASGPNRWVVRGKGTPLKDHAINFLRRRGYVAKIYIGTGI